MRATLLIFAPSLPALLRYFHLPLRDRARLPVTTLRLRSAKSLPHETFDLALDVAALTHGAPSGFITAADAALIAATVLSADDLSAGIARAICAIETVDPESHHLNRYAEAAADGDRSPADDAVLRRHGGDRTAISTLSAAP